ncbi:Hypothetical predicted protein, partial [Prunus dulcis]
MDDRKMKKWPRGVLVADAKLQKKMNMETKRHRAKRRMEECLSAAKDKCVGFGNRILK